MTQPTELSSWKELTTHHHDMRDFSLREELDKSDRLDTLSIIFEDMMFDFSKHLITKDTTDLLISLAQASGIEKTARPDVFWGLQSTIQKTVLFYMWPAAHQSPPRSW